MCNDGGSVTFSTYPIFRVYSIYLTMQFLKSTHFIIYFYLPLYAFPGTYPFGPSATISLYPLSPRVRLPCGKCVGARVHPLAMLNVTQIAISHKLSVAERLASILIKILNSKYSAAVILFSL